MATAHTSAPRPWGYKSVSRAHLLGQGGVWQPEIARVRCSFAGLGPAWQEWSLLQCPCRALELQQLSGNQIGCPLQLSPLTLTQNTRPPWPRPAGVAKEADVVAVRILDCTGSGTISGESQLERAWHWLSPTHACRHLSPAATG